MLDTVNNINDQDNDISAMDIVNSTRPRPTGYVERRKLERRDMQIWEGNEDTNGPWEHLTTFLHQVNYGEVEGPQNHVSQLYRGVCPNEECASHAGKDKRALQIQVYRGVQASVRVWCEECTYDEFPTRGKELVDMALRKAKSNQMEGETPKKVGFDILLDHSADDLGNARVVNELHGNSIAYTDAMGWLGRNGKEWEGMGTR